MAGEMYISGLTNTGFDYEGYLSKLAELKSIPINNLKAQQQALIAKSTSIVGIKSTLSDFLSPLLKLEDSANYEKYSATLTNSDVASVSVSSGAAQGEYNLTVNSIATANSFVIESANAISDPDAAMSDSGTLTINYKKDGTDTSLDIDYTGKSLNDIAKEINDTSDDLQATVVNDNGNYKLLVSSKNVGSGNAITSIADSDGDDTTGFTTDSSKTKEIQAATDAEIVLNGMSFTNTKSNTFDNILAGVTITAQESGSTDLSIQKDYSSIKSALKSILSTYNQLKSTINSETKRGAALQGETSLTSITSSLFREISDTLGKYGLVDSIGEGENATGDLKLNESRFDELMNDKNFDAKEIFGNFAHTFESRVNNFSDSLSLVNQKYTQRSKQMADEIDGKTKRLQEEIERLRIRYAKLDVQLSKMKDIQLRIENFTKALTGQNK